MEPAADPAGALAARALDERLARGGGHDSSGSVLWIGRAVWPYAATLLAADTLREHAPGALGAPGSPALASAGDLEPSASTS
ncbi:MAG: hypothetical protein R3F49_10675 [Planctomycetota bacterium]